MINIAGVFTTSVSPDHTCDHTPEPSISKRATTRSTLEKLVVVSIIFRVARSALVIVRGAEVQRAMRILLLGSSQI